MATYAVGGHGATDRARALRATIDERIEALAKAVDDERASAEFRAYLDVQARFHNYSWHNCMLIYSQRPDATRVAGFRTWKKMGRHVRKGEHGIMILAPCPFKRTTTDDDGTERVVGGIYFKAVHVFDAAQTDGKPLPAFDVADVEQAADDLLSVLKAVALGRGIRLAYVDLRPGHYGTSKGGTIELANGMASGQAAKTLAHELAHESLHKPKDRTDGLTRTVAELEAEAAAYIVCQHFGLAVEVRSSRYIALWGGDGKGLRASLDRISETARAIIDDAETAKSGPGDTAPAAALAA